MLEDIYDHPLWTHKPKHVIDTWQPYVAQHKEVSILLHKFKTLYQQKDLMKWWSHIFMSLMWACKKQRITGLHCNYFTQFGITDIQLKIRSQQ